VGRRHSETELAQVRNLVLDTGPIVALLDATDAEHARSREALADFRGELWTTCAVITEIMHLLGRYTLGPRTVVEFVAANRLRIEGCGDLNTLKTRKICTLDRRGFMTYRTLDGKRFTVIP
jgi:predicted nucleic acid-binding protein